MQHTTRDQLWATAIAETAKRGSEISSKGLAELAGASERTARDVLKTMANVGILTEKKDGRRTVYRISDGYDPS